jgi:hypothetical protein
MLLSDDDEVLVVPPAVVVIAEEGEGEEIDVDVVVEDVVISGFRRLFFIVLLDNRIDYII